MWCLCKKYLDRQLLKKYPEHLELCTSPNVALLNPRMEPQDLMECSYASTGFLCIRKNVFETMVEKFPERKYINTIDGYMGIGSQYFTISSTSI